MRVRFIFIGIGILSRTNNSLENILDNMLVNFGHCLKCTANIIIILHISFRNHRIFWSKYVTFCTYSPYPILLFV